MFDVTLQVVHAQVVGHENSVELFMMIGLAIPGPNGANQGMIPAGIVRVPLGRDIAIETGKNLQEEGEKLPVPTDLEIVTDPEIVAKAARGPSDPE